ncbi:MAG: sigma-54 dependent transcriptional regulator [candidate division WOR-3 bacterium]|nr:sigma-54 dependent transcriptional regulator [candidate division WOR-3 bacterium]
MALKGKQNYKILIIDDETKICEILRDILENEGYSADFATNGTDGLRKIQKDKIDLVLLDVKLPDTDGLSLLKRIKDFDPDISVVMISAFGTVSTAVEALKNGAEDFIEKPLEINRILITIKNALEKIELKRQSTGLKSEMLKEYMVIGESEGIKKVLSLVEKAAPTNSTILILGETGTGKDLIAHNIHLRSQRAGKPFVKVNCAALPGELIESELFGYEKGAFTGAFRRKIGQFEFADKGTLFLNEIGDMGLSTQAKVLSAIEDKEIVRLGGTERIKIDVRIIAATNQNLLKLIKEKKFREDLYHRLNVLTIHIPPLRERLEDIPLLAEHFLTNACVENNRPIKILTKKASQFLKQYHWPGNVRELKYLMEKLAILTTRIELDVNDVLPILEEIKKDSGIQYNIDIAKEELEKSYIISALQEANGHMGKAAKILGIDRSTLFRKIKKLGIKI